jgi:hypothetical protein
MYTALDNQTNKAAELLADLRSSMSLDDFYRLVYDQLVRPSWGWSFTEYWKMVDWVLDHPEGGPRWMVDPGTSMDRSVVRRLVAELARRWMRREEASASPVGAIVDEILSKLNFRD